MSSSSYTISPTKLWLLDQEIVFGSVLTNLLLNTVCLPKITVKTREHHLYAVWAESPAKVKLVPDKLDILQVAQGCSSTFL